MNIRDIKHLTSIIDQRLNLGLPLDYSINHEFEKKLKHKNFIFSNGINLVNEYFNLESKSKSTLLSKSVQVLGNNNSIKRIITKIADQGIIF